MKSNTKYTILEILTAAGFEKPEELIGKVRVRVGGLSGIVSPDHVIKVTPGTEKVDIVVGNEVKELVFDGDAKDLTLSDEVKRVKKENGVVATQKAEALQKAKAEAKAEK